MHEFVYRLGLAGLPQSGLFGARLARRRGCGRLAAGPAPDRGPIRAGLARGGGDIWGEGP